MGKLFKKILSFFSNLYKKYPVLLYFIISNLINGLLIRLLTLGSFCFRAVFFDITIVFLLSGISLLIKKGSRNIYYVITSLIMVFICVVNSMYYNYYSSYVSVSLLATSVFALDVADAVVDFAIKTKDFVYIWQLIGLFICIRKYKDGDNVKGNCSMFCSLAIVMLAIGCTLPPYSSWAGFLKLWNRVVAVEGFGVYMYQLDDFVHSLSPAFNTVFGYDKALQETKEYFENNPNKKSNNEYTGIFEGKNVIAIHAESLQSFVVNLTINDREVTPNINKLISNGIYFSNFYAQQSIGTSSDSEFTYSSSLLPANNGTVFVNYYNNKYVTIQNELKKKNYYVFSMHGNVGDFWNREIMHANMGYDKFYSKSSYEIDEEFGLGLSDMSFFRQSVSIIEEISKEIGSPYYGTLITLTNHTPWGDADKISDLDVSMSVTVNGETIKRDYLETNVLGRYLKSVNYMDKAIGEFISLMDEKGLLDNTVIVIYGDHDANINRRNYNYMYNYDPVTDSVKTDSDEGYVNYNKYEHVLNKKVPFIIWSKDFKEGTEISTPMGMIDVSPTLGNMLNIYNPYALGHDVMNITNGENIVVFKDGSYITDKIYYNASKREVYSIGNNVITEDYLEKNNDYVNEIIKISDNIISYDLLKEMK